MSISEKLKCVINKHLLKDPRKLPCENESRRACLNCIREELNRRPSGATFVCKDCQTVHFVPGASILDEDDEFDKNFRKSFHQVHKVMYEKLENQIQNLKGIKIN